LKVGSETPVMQITKFHGDIVEEALDGGRAVNFS
jgi:hypothetical protein